MTNADKFKSLFGLYATELWAMPEKDFLKWLNSEAMNCSEFPNNSDTISRQAAVDALDVLCQEHRYRIPGKRETYSEYNEAWQDALDRAEGAIGNLPSAQPKRGKWVFKTVFPNDTSEFPMGYLVCSECGSKHPNKTPCNFCDNCGADMRTKETDCDYERAVEQLEHDMLYEPTFNPDDGSM